MEVFDFLKNKLRMTSHGETLRKQSRWLLCSLGLRRKATHTPEAARAKMISLAATISVILERFFRKDRRRCEAFGSCVSSGACASWYPRNFSAALLRSKLR